MDNEAITIDKYIIWLRYNNIGRYKNSASTMGKWL